MQRSERVIYSPLGRALKRETERQCRFALTTGLGSQFIWNRSTRRAGERGGPRLRRSSWARDSDHHRRILNSGDDLQCAGAFRAATMLPIASAIAVSVIAEPNRSTFFSNGSAKCSSGVMLGLTIRTSASLLLTGKSGLVSFKNWMISSSFPLTGIPTTPSLPSWKILLSTRTSFSAV